MSDCEHSWQARRCTLCGEEMDGNEDDACCHCGKLTGGRFLYCSAACSDASDAEQMKPATQPAATDTAGGSDGEQG